MHLAADCLESRRELLDEVRELPEVRPAAPLQVFTARVEVEALESRVAPRAQPGHRVRQGSLEVRVVQGLVDAARKVPAAFSHEYAPCARPAQARDLVAS